MLITIRVTNSQPLKIEVIMVEADILADVVAKVMVVTNSAGVADRLELLEHRSMG